MRSQTLELPPPKVTIKRMTESAVKESRDPSTTEQKMRWRWAIFAGIAMAVLALYPQIDLWVTRGADWQGSFAYHVYDENIYATYVNGLLLGRPRRSEPLGTLNDGKPLHESLFSIQLVPAYAIALPARVLGLTASQAFILLTPVTAFLSVLAMFYLLALLTRDDRLSVAGALSVLCFGALAICDGVARKWMGSEPWFTHLPFLRRYEPCVGFPLFFVLIALIWHAFTGQGVKARRAAIGAGVVFVLLIFSYFYLWTPAFVWLGCLTIVWLIARSFEWRLVARRLAPTALLGAGGLGLYAFMLTQRGSAMDSVQMLELSRAPDLLRVPEFIGAITIVLLIWGARKGRLLWRDPLPLFGLSMALAPFVVFNQQLITGRSLQPFHYEGFITNYVALVGLFLILVIYWRGGRTHTECRAPKLAMIVLACAAVGWGWLEVDSTTRMRHAENVSHDMFVPVAKRLAALAAERGKDPHDRELVFSPDMYLVSDNIAVYAPQTALWSTYLPSAGGLSLEEQHDRFFQYAYYSGKSVGRLAQELANKNHTAINALFGLDRFDPVFAVHFRPPTSEEVQAKVQKYAAFLAAFNRERAARTQLSYVVTINNPKEPLDFSNLDRWYRRDQGEKIGLFTLYQVKLRE